MARRIPPPMIDAGRFLGGPLIINRLGTGRFDGYLHRIAATTEKSVTPTLATEIVPVLVVGEDARYDDYQDYWAIGLEQLAVAAQNSFVGVRALSGRGVVDFIDVSSNAGAVAGYSLGWSSVPGAGLLNIVARRNVVQSSPGLNLASIQDSTGTTAAPAFTPLGNVYAAANAVIRFHGPFILDPVNPLFLTVFTSGVNVGLRATIQGRQDSGFRRQMTS